MLCQDSLNLSQLTLANVHGKWKDGMGKGARWHNAMHVNSCVLQTLSRF